MRTTVRLPESLLEKARKRAMEQGRTLTSLIEEGLNRVLADVKPAHQKKVRLPLSKAKGGTLPGVDLNRSSDLEDIMEARSVAER